MQLQKK